MAKKRNQSRESKALERQHKVEAAGRRTDRESRLKELFSARLEAARFRKNWNQSRLAAEASRYLPKPPRGEKKKEIGRDSISNYCRGNTLPREEHLIPIAKALEMSPEELLPRGKSPEAIADALSDEPPAFRMTPSGDGRVWLRVNRVVTMATALKISNLLNEEDAA